MNEEIERPSYYAIIPAEVRYDKNLSPNAKLLYGEITALASKTGECYSTNKYFANLYDLSQVSVSRLIKSLADNGYITIKTTYKGGTKEIDKRYIQICKEGINKNDNYPLNKNVKENNTSNINNTSINNTPYNPPKEDCKKENTKTTYNQILDDLVKDNDVKETLKEFIKMRKLIKKPLTDYALKKIINKLNKMTSYSTEQIEILNQSITNSWQDIYALKKQEEKHDTTIWV